MFLACFSISPYWYPVTTGESQHQLCLTHAQSFLSMSWHKGFCSECLVRLHSTHSSRPVSTIMSFKKSFYVSSSGQDVFFLLTPSTLVTSLTLLSSPALCNNYLSVHQLPDKRLLEGRYFLLLFLIASPA